MVLSQVVLGKNSADAVAFGRPFIANPDLPLSFAHRLPPADDDAATWFTED
ncbi:MAG: hypothetical protein ACOH2H_02555 [Cypionkella sp.]